MRHKNLPESIKEYIKDKPYFAENIGMSSSEIYMFDDMVLKIQGSVAEAEREIAVCRFLEGKLPAPKIIAHEVTDGKSFVLMSRMKGKMLCDY